MTLANRVADKLDELNFSLEYVARKCGVSAGAVFKVANGKTKKPGFIVELADVLGVSVNWLQRGIDGPEEKIRKTQPTQGGSSLYPLNVHDLVPLYGPASAGLEKTYLTEENMIGQEPRPPALQNVKGGFMMLVSGDCMEPRHFHGEKVWVHPYKPPAVNDDCVIVMDPEGDAQIKRYLGETAKEIKLMQWNPKREFTVSKKDVRNIFAIVR